MRLFALGGSREFGESVARAADLVLDPIEEREFEGGEHKSRPLVSVRNEDVFVIQSLAARGGQSPADRLLRLLFFLATCRDNGAAQVTALVPFMAFMRKEVQTKPRDPVTSRYIAALFEAVRPDMIVAIEVHNKAAFQNAFRGPTLHLDMHHLFVEAIARLADASKLVFMTPDSGGMKRADLLRQAFVAEGHGEARLAMMEKHRSEGVVSGELFAGDVNGADVVVVDDIISTGGTILRAAEAAKARGARRVFAVATHGLFDVGAEALLTSGLIERIVVSDSVAVPSRLTGSALGKLEIVSCAPMLAETIKRLRGGGSINRLLNPMP